jgi:hypothetical protein
VGPTGVIEDSAGEVEELFTVVEAVGMVVLEGAAWGAASAPASNGSKVRSDGADSILKFERENKKGVRELALRNPLPERVLLYILWSSQPESRGKRFKPEKRLCS